MVMYLVRVDARAAELEKEKRVKERLERMSARSRNRGQLRYKLSWRLGSRRETKHAGSNS